MSYIIKIKNRIKSDIRRFNNSKVAYAYPDCADGWEKCRNPVMGSKEAGIFFDPFVRKYGSKLTMMASHRNTRSIVRAYSTDGFSWSLPEVVLSPKAESWEQNVNRACFLIKNQQWYMWYTGMNDSHSEVGLAISPDGVYFERVENSAVLYPTLPFEQNAVMNPCVLWDEDENLFKMWYSAGEKYEPDVICYATSIDGLTWNKHRKPVLMKGNNPCDHYKVGGCDVHKTACSKYVMYYIGYQNLDVARICRATSKDGINWIRDDNNPIISPTKGSWDSDAVYKPSVLYNESDEAQFIWYNGRRNRKEYIGMATRNLQ